MERLPNRYPKISQSHKVPLYKGLSLFYPKLHKIFVIHSRISFFREKYRLVSISVEQSNGIFCKFALRLQSFTESISCIFSKNKSKKQT